MRSLLYKTARVLGDLHALETGRLPQRLVRRKIYKHSFRLANFICRLLGL